MTYPIWLRIVRPRHLLGKRSQRKVCHLSLSQFCGALTHAYIPARSNQAHQLMPKGQPLFAWLAQVLDDP
jgi:hypothetical protein